MTTLSINKKNFEWSRAQSCKKTEDEKQNITD